MWTRKWKQAADSASNDIPSKLVDSLKACDSAEFPNLKILLHLALTLPVTSCESERSFSQIKLIKNSIRATMNDERLNGLALMKINRGRCENIQRSEDKVRELVQSFARLHPRRMKLPFILADQD